MIDSTSALQALLLRLADNKYALGERYRAWSESASLPEPATGVADLALTEHNHAQILYMLAHDNGAVEPADPDARLPYAIPFLIAPWRHWISLIAVDFLFDSAMSILLAAALESSYAPLAEFARIALADEQGHRLYGEGWVRRLGSEGGPVAHSLETALQQIWDDVLCWFGPQHDADAEILYSAKILAVMPNILRARLLARIGPFALAANIRIPARPAARGNTWELAHPLPWERWHPAHWRLEPVQTEMGL